MEKKYLRIIVIVVGCILVLNVIRSFVFLSNANTFNAEGIKIAANKFKSAKEVEVHDNGSTIQINVIIDSESRTLTTDNYVEIRDFFEKLSKMDNANSEIYVVSLDIRNSAYLGICGVVALTTDIFSTEWGKITDIKELANKLDLVIY